MNALAAGLILVLWATLAGAEPTRYFISDLHLGVGRDSTGKWSPLEDFRWHDDLVGFLNHVSHATSNNAQLIILGDFVELWQSANMQCRENGLIACRTTDCISGTAPDRGCPGTEALARLERVTKEHAKTLRELGAFTSRGSNSLVVVPGNHDAALLMPSVATALVAAIGAAPGRLEFRQQGYWLSPDGRILGEHGHQFDRVNRFRTWPSPFEQEAPNRMERPWGEQMVQEFYNQYEAQFPIVDNLNSEAEGLRLGIATLHAKGIAIAVNRFLWFLLFETSGGQFVDFLGDAKRGTPREWDVASVKRSKDTAFLASSMDRDDPAYEAVRASLLNNELTVRPADLTDDDIRELCDKRLLLQEKYRRKRSHDQIEQCPLVDQARHQNLGYVVDKVLQRGRANEMRYIGRRFAEIEKEIGRKPAIDAYIFGHTHSSTNGELLTIGPRKVLSINDGAFQRLISDRALSKLVRDRQLKTADVLTQLGVEDLTPCYSFVRVDPYGPAEKPRPVTRWWTQKTGSWAESGSCD